MVPTGNWYGIALIAYCLCALKLLCFALGCFKVGNGAGKQGNLGRIF